MATFSSLRAEEVVDRLAAALEVGAADRRETHGSWVLLTRSRAYTEAAADARALTRTEPVVVGVRGRGPDALVAAADDLEATLLVLGSRSLAGLRAFASVSERVGASAHCPVLVMRDQASADARFASRSSG